MCYSAAASFVSGGVLTSLGGYALTKTTRTQEKALASIPFIFGSQQFIEGFIWRGSMTSLTGPTILTYTYLFFALILWPSFMPIAIGLVEPNPDRKKWISSLSIPAGISSFFYIHVLWKYPVLSQIHEDHIQYLFTIHPPALISVFYCMGTVLPCLLSSQRWLVGFGVVLSLGLIVSHFIYSDVMVSIFCFFSALLSGILCLYFLSLNTRKREYETLYID